MILTITHLLCCFNDDPTVVLLADGGEPPPTTLVTISSAMIDSSLSLSLSKSPPKLLQMTSTISYSSVFRTFCVLSDLLKLSSAFSTTLAVVLSAVVCFFAVNCFLVGRGSSLLDIVLGTSGGSPLGNVLCVLAWSLPRVVGLEVAGACEYTVAGLWVTNDFLEDSCSETMWKKN